MIATKIPYDFVRLRANLSWRDVQFGLEYQLIAPQVAIDKATDRLCEPDDASEDEVDLANRSDDEQIMELVERLADAEEATTDHVQAKWVYLILAWLFERRASVHDPLGMVEEVYSDFGYPPEIAAFVRYMPMVGPDLGNREQNEARLYDHWKSYLVEAGKRFACSPGKK